VKPPEPWDATRDADESDPPIAGDRPVADGQPAAVAPASASSVYRFIHAGEPSLEDCMDRFWSAGPTFEELPDPPPLPDEPFDILKRLGPSPFSGGGFPLIGFFASAYERVSRLARERRAPPAGMVDDRDGST